MKPARSADRIKRSSQRQGVWQALKKKKWISVHSIKTKGSDSALTARIRELRRKAYGAHVVLCQRFADGWKYRLVK